MTALPAPGRPAISPATLPQRDTTLIPPQTRPHTHGEVMSDQSNSPERISRCHHLGAAGTAGLGGLGLGGAGVAYSAGAPFAVTLVAAIMGGICTIARFGPSILDLAQKATSDRESRLRDRSMGRDLRALHHQIATQLLDTNAGGKRAHLLIELQLLGALLGRHHQPRNGTSAPYESGQSRASHRDPG